MLYPTGTLVRLAWMVCLATLSAGAWAQKTPDKDVVSAVEYRGLFSDLSSDEIKNKLVLMLITDEDPYQATDVKPSAGKNTRADRPAIWCGHSFLRSYTKMLETRPDLGDRCLIQQAVAGQPAFLTGGRYTNLPRRVVMVLTDGHYRILNFCVGLPDAEEMIQFIEDGEESQALLSLHEQSRVLAAQEIWQRSKDRVGRTYREAMERHFERDPLDTELSDTDPLWNDRWIRLASLLNAEYLAEVQLRFSFSEASDRIRLHVLEQHRETRAHWCECLAPELLGRSAIEVLKPLVDAAWGMTPVIRSKRAEHIDLIDWAESHKEDSTIVLGLMPSMVEREIAWPPPDVNPQQDARYTWQALETVMADHAFRMVDAEELAILMREYEQPAMDLYIPSRARYAVFSPQKKHLYLIRETELPRKYISRLSRD